MLILKLSQKKNYILLPDMNLKILEGYILTFSKALYGLKSCGKRWAETLYDIWKDMDFIPSQGDHGYG